MSVITVIIPTYNEAKSIGNLIDAVESEIKTITSHTVQILIVDGNSPDCTSGIVREKSKKYQNLHLLVEKKKQGLGMAYINGMRYAVEQLQSDAFIEFDGDFQHNPKDIGRLVKEFDRGYDYVIGSRYVAGGSVPAAWAWYRKVLSRFGSLFAKFILQLSTHDNTSGLKLTRVKGFFETLSLSKDKILSYRYAYKFQLLHEMIRAGAKVKEIPIAFLPRERGDSKSSLRDIFESLKVIMLLRLRISK